MVSTKIKTKITREKERLEIKPILIHLCCTIKLGSVEGLKSVREVVLHDYINVQPVAFFLKRNTQVDQRIAGIQPLNKKSEMNL